MSNQRLSQAKLQQCLGALQALITAVHDARVRYQDCAKLRPGRLSGLSRYLKDLLAIEASEDLTPFEPQLKRRLVRVQHRLFGLPGTDVNDNYVLAGQLPSVYDGAVDRYAAAARLLLRSLADVDIKRDHQPQVTVRQQLGLAD